MTPLPPDHKIHEAASAAQEAFWRVIAAAFPQVKTGDFSPLDQMVFDLWCEKAIRTWLETNWPDETFTQRQEAHRLAHPNTEEPF